MLKNQKRKRHSNNRALSSAKINKMTQGNTAVLRTAVLPAWATIFPK